MYKIIGYYSAIKMFIEMFDSFAIDGLLIKKEKNILSKSLQIYNKHFNFLNVIFFSRDRAYFKDFYNYLSMIVCKEKIIQLDDPHFTMI